MPASDALPPPPVPGDRSRRVYMWWGVGFAFLAALGLVCWLVVGPAVEVHRIAMELSSSPFSYFPAKAEAERAVERLGGPDRAARKIGIYLRLPARLTGGEASNSRLNAAATLGCCGKAGLRQILRLLRSSSPWQQGTGYWALMTFTIYQQPDGILKSGNMTENLRGFLDHGDAEVRELVREIMAVLKARESPLIYPK